MIRLSCESQDHVAIISINGDLIASVCDNLRQETIKQVELRLQDIVLDCNSLHYIDSVGLETLVWLQDYLAEHLGELKFINCSEQLITIFEMTRLKLRFECVESLQVAIGSLSCGEVFDDSSL
ncbi:STAS domain-containing protein [Planctomycetota bacterium]|nr:STAS domain-containing protein [Planctomycetota bacterium]